MMRNKTIQYVNMHIISTHYSKSEFGGGLADGDFAAGLRVHFWGPTGLGYGRSVNVELGNVILSFTVYC